MLLGTTCVIGWLGMKLKNEKKNLIRFHNFMSIVIILLKRADCSITTKAPK